MMPSGQERRNVVVTRPKTNTTDPESRDGADIHRRRTGVPLSLYSRPEKMLTFNISPTEAQNETNARCYRHPLAVCRLGSLLARAKSASVQRSGKSVAANRRFSPESG